MVLRDETFNSELNDVMRTREYLVDEVAKVGERCEADKMTEYRDHRSNRRKQLISNQSEVW